MTDATDTNDGGTDEESNENERSFIDAQPLHLLEHTPDCECGQCGNPVLPISVMVEHDGLFCEDEDTQFLACPTCAARSPLGLEGSLEMHVEWSFIKWVRDPVRAPEGGFTSYIVGKDPVPEPPIGRGDVEKVVVEPEHPVLRDIFNKNAHEEQ